MDLHISFSYGSLLSLICLSQLHITLISCFITCLSQTYTSAFYNISVVASTLYNASCVITKTQRGRVRDA